MYIQIIKFDSWVPYDINTYQIWLSPVDANGPLAVIF